MIKMKVPFSICLCVLYISAYAQLNLTQEEIISRRNYYESGKELLEKKKYKEADSLLTLSINIRPERISAYYRGLARLGLGDICSFCTNMQYAAGNNLMKYTDGSINHKAQVLLNKYCFNIDTIFYDKKMKISNMKNYRYYNVQKISNCYNDTIVEIHDIKKNRIVQNLNETIAGTDDIVAVYKLINGVKYFVTCDKAPELKYENEPVIFYLNKAIDLSKEIKNKTIVRFFVTTEGKVENIRFYWELELRHSKYDYIQTTEFPSQYKLAIEKAIYSLRDILPARYKNKKVNFEFTLDTLW